MGRATCGRCQLAGGQRGVPGVEPVRAGVEVGAQGEVDLHGSASARRRGRSGTRSGRRGPGRPVLLAHEDLLGQGAPAELGDRRGRQGPRIGIADGLRDAGDLRCRPTAIAARLGRQEAPADARRREVELLQRGERRPATSSRLSASRGRVEDRARASALVVSRRDVVRKSGRLADDRDAQGAAARGARRTARAAARSRGPGRRGTRSSAASPAALAPCRGRRRTCPSSGPEHPAVRRPHRPRRPLEHGEERLLDVAAVVQPGDLGRWHARHSGGARREPGRGGRRSRRRLAAREPSRAARRAAGGRRAALRAARAVEGSSGRDLWPGPA